MILIFGLSFTQDGRTRKFDAIYYLSTKIYIKPKKRVTELLVAVSSRVLGFLCFYNIKIYKIHFLIFWSKLLLWGDSPIYDKKLSYICKDFYFIRVGSCLIKVGGRQWSIWAEGNPSIWVSVLLDNSWLNKAEIRRQRWSSWRKLM